MKNKLFIYSNSQVERAYVESFKQYFWKLVNGKDNYGNNTHSLGYLEKFFFPSAFMVANYAAIRESYEQSLSGKNKTVEQHQQCYTMEPNFSEVCEHIKERLLETQKAAEQKEKEERKRQRENQIRAQHKREVEEWESKSIIACYKQTT